MSRPKYGRVTASHIRVLLLAFVAGCGGRSGPDAKEASSAGETRDRAALVVLAPHPDDEILMAGGVLAAARQRGSSAAVVLATNGDFTCERNGYLRQGESVEGLKRVGVDEPSISFLGYPDGWLAELGVTSLSGVPRRNAQGACVYAATTYGSRGRAGKDEHTAREGKPAPYDAKSFVADVAAVLARTRPADIYVTHGIDTHPDHWATYVALRRALETLPTRSWRVHRAIVHAPGPCWPNGSSRWEPCASTPFTPNEGVPPLPPPLAAYVPTERVALGGPAAVRTKMTAIAAYRSQLGDPPESDWLASFARTEEVFFPETLVRAADGHVERAESGPRRRFAATVAITEAAGEAAWSLATNDGALGYRFVFTGGHTIELHRIGRSDPRPMRTFPLPQDGTEHAAHRFDVMLDRRLDDGAATEITVRRDGEFFGLGVDVEAPTQPLHAARETKSGSTVELSER